MRGALSVRVNDGYTDRYVTEHVRDLRFRKTAPGGFHSGSMRLVVPRTTFRDLGPADKVYIYDRRNGATVFEGFTENPGTADGSGGQAFELGFMGSSILASDQSEKLIYVDAALDQWRRDDYGEQAPSASTQVGSLPDTGTPALVLQFPPGQPIAGAATARMVYDAFLGSPHTLGGFTMTNRAGVADANYESRWVAGSTIAATRAFALAGLTVTRWALTDFAAGENILNVRIQRVAGGATNITNDNIWGGFANVRVFGQRVDRYGAQVASTSTAGVLASSVVEDLLGRLMRFCDPAAAEIQVPTKAFIDQLAFHDGVTAAGVLDWLVSYEPTYLWEILHHNGRGYVFRFRRWPTTARYEISTSDGYNAPGGDVDLCNRIGIYWTDPKGNTRVRFVGAAVPALGDGSPVNPDGTPNPFFAGRIRDAEPITLPEGLGSDANALSIGTEVLAEKANPPKAGTADLRRPVFDHVTRNHVMPWEIEPGYPIRVRETGDVLPCTEVEYNDADVAATLTLGRPMLTTEQRIARLTRATGGRA